METLRIKTLALAAALLAAVPMSPADSAPVAIGVKLSVTFVPTSGSCSALQAQSGFEVLCGQPVVVTGIGGGGGTGAGMFRGNRGPGGTGTGGPGAAPAGDAAAPDSDGSPAAEGSQAGEFVTGAVVGPRGLYGYSAAEISSWRLVSLHNGAYVELTIAW